MTVTTNDRRISYSPGAGTTALPYDFPIQDDDEIIVYLTRGGGTTTLTKTTDYTVSGVGVAGGGTVTLVSASIASDVYVLDGNTPVTRATDFQQRGDWAAADVNAEFDRFVLMLQEFVRDYSTFVLRFSNAFTGTVGTIPATIGANEVLARNGANTGWVGTAIVPGGSVQSASETVAGIAELSSTAEANAALNDTTIMTPLKVKTQINTRVAATPWAISEGGTGQTTAAAAFTALIQAAAAADIVALSSNVKSVTPLGLTLRPAFHAHKNGSNQGSMTSTGLIKVTFGTERYDIGSYFASSTWTPPAGRHHIDVSVLWTNANGVDNEVMSISLLKNGGEIAFGQNNRNSTGTVQCQISVDVEANGTDTFEVYGTKGGAGDGTVDGTATRTFFSGHAI